MTLSSLRRSVFRVSTFLIVFAAGFVALPSESWATSARCLLYANVTQLVNNYNVPASPASGLTLAPPTDFEPGETVTVIVSSPSVNNSFRVTTKSVASLTTGNNEVQYFTNNGPQGFVQVIAPGDTGINIILGKADVQTTAVISLQCTPAAGAGGQTNSNILEQMRQTYSKVAAQTTSTATGDATSGAIGDAFSGGGTTQFGATGFTTNFAALEKMRDAEDAKESSDPFAALAYKKSSVAYAKLFKKAPPPRLQSPWHVWIDGRWTGFDDKRPASFDGWQTNINAGASYRFTQNFLAGVIVGFEDFRYSLTTAGVPASLNGNGVQGGGYFGWRFYDRLRLDGMLTYGRTDYTAGAGGVTGSFGGDRVVGMTKLSGRYGMGSYFIEPSSMLTVASERQGSFIDSAAVIHNNFNFTVGRFSNGATVGTAVPWGMCVVTPTFGAFADYRFGDQTLAATNVVPTFNNGWSARVNGGLSFAMPNNVTASATGEYGGLGDGIQYWRAKGSLGVKF